MKTSKIKIYQFGLLIMVSLLIFSCGQSESWGEKDKMGFISGCVKANKNRISEEQANEMCNCMLDKMMEKHPTMAASQKMNPEEIKEIARSCISSK